MAEFRWYGHNCFRIKTREATILTDPVGKNTGYAMPRQTADIVTLSHDHAGHANLAAVKPEFKVIDGPGEYEMHDVFITGIRTYHDTAAGRELGYNTVYLIEAEGMIICHLGDLGHLPNADQIEQMAQCDILLVPVGGGPLVSPEQAAEVVSQLEPKLVIPMQFQTPIGDAGRGALEPFMTALGMPAPERTEKLVVRLSELTDVMQIAVLEPDSEAAKR
ncbi:MAG: MBL fold metallo-hydrolase [Thermomicrobiales bacterium]|jgi:L-ascorbate metabolism protein UlaG (beta-lactamase superfamily)|nr:MBL fold metallo-hydrolase [Thermomicrobiales bacterium]